jgi:hypothetical protein
LRQDRPCDVVAEPDAMLLSAPVYLRDASAQALIAKAAAFDLQQAKMAELKKNGRWQHYQQLPPFKGQAAQPSALVVASMSTTSRSCSARSAPRKVSRH